MILLISTSYFFFFQNLKYFSKCLKITKNNYVFYFILAISQKLFNVLQKEKDGL